MKKKKVESKSESMEWREAIEFLLRWAAISTEEMREGDRLNLIDDCRRYLEIEGDGQPARELEEAKKKPAKLTDTVKAISRLVEEFADRKSPKVKIGPITMRIDTSRLGEGRQPIFSDGALKDVMLDTAAYDLVQAEPWQICRCRECPKGVSCRTQGTDLLLASLRERRRCANETG
jgi:hypothetical protein